MKKQLIVIGIAVILTFIGLSGCNSTEQTNEQKQTPEDLIIGKWYYAIEDAYFTFYKNRSICMNIANEKFWGEYGINKTRLIYTIWTTDTTTIFKYSFTDNNQKLTLTTTEGYVRVLTRQ